jgi:hypothetical protein
MTRPTKHLGLLVSSTLALAAVMASAAWAGDRYGPADPQGGGYASSGYGYQSEDRTEDRQVRTEYDAQFRQGGDDLEQVDPCAMQYRQTGRGCSSDRRVSGHETRLYSREGGDDVEQVDPCAVQHRLTGRGCESDRGFSGHETRRYSRVEGDDAREIDPCAMQYQVIGRGCSSDGAVFERETGSDRDRSAWRSDRIHEGEANRASAYDRFDDQDAYVDAREAPRERFAEHCLCQDRGRFERSGLDRRAWRDDDRVVWVEERLPDSFFFSDGGVGPGIVDFGGGGGGGGGNSSIFIDSSARANASASAMASASAAIMMKNHRMMKMPYGYGQKMMPHYSSGGGHWK